MLLDVKIQPNLITKVTGSYGSISYTRGRQMHEIEFYKSQPPQYFKNGVNAPIENTPITILTSIIKCAKNLNFNRTDFGVNYVT